MSDDKKLDKDVEESTEEVVGHYNRMAPDPNAKKEQEVKEDKNAGGGF